MQCLGSRVGCTPLKCTVQVQERLAHLRAPARQSRCPGPDPRQKRRPCPAPPPHSAASGRSGLPAAGVRVGRVGRVGGAERDPRASPTSPGWGRKRRRDPSRMVMQKPQRCSAAPASGQLDRAAAKPCPGAVSQQRTHLAVRRLPRKLALHDQGVGRGHGKGPEGHRRQRDVGRPPRSRRVGKQALDLRRGQRHRSAKPSKAFGQSPSDYPATKPTPLLQTSQRDRLARPLASPPWRWSCRQLSSSPASVPSGELPRSWRGRALPPRRLPSCCVHGAGPPESVAACGPERRRSARQGDQEFRS